MNMMSLVQLGSSLVINPPSLCHTFIGKPIWQLSVSFDYFVDYSSHWSSLHCVLLVELPSPPRSPSPLTRGVRIAAELIFHQRSYLNQSAVGYSGVCLLSLSPCPHCDTDPLRLCSPGVPSHPSTHSLHLWPLLCLLQSLPLDPPHRHPGPLPPTPPFTSLSSSPLPGLLR
jgi:hypothetical protein